MLRRRTDPIPGGLGDGWVIRATTGSRFIGWLTVKSLIPDRERKIGCNKNPRRRAEFLSSALLFKFDQDDECTLAPQLAPRCLVDCLPSSRQRFNKRTCDLSFVRQ